MAAIIVQSPGDGIARLGHYRKSFDDVARGHLPKLTPAELERMKQMNPISPADRKEKKEEDEFLSGR